MSLEQMFRFGLLAKYKTSRQEISELLELAGRDLEQSKAEELSNDWKLKIAFESALVYAAAALRACGYRADGPQHHFHTIESLKHTIKAPDVVVSLFREFSKKRNISAYITSGTVSEQECKEMIELAAELKTDVTRWIRTQHPELI